MGRERSRVVVVGAGFAGLAAARAMAGGHGRGRVQVTLLDRHNHHVFTPFLYQVATALLEPSGAAQPVRALTRRLGGVEVRLAEVSGVDLTRRVVETNRGDVPYDYLIPAAGSENDFFGHPELAVHTYGLNDLGQALALRNRVLSSFEAAAWATDPAERARLLTVAVVGGGPTGVELSAALAVLVGEMVGRDFPAIGHGEPRVVLVEASGEPLPSFAPGLRRAASEALGGRGIEVRSGARATGADERGLALEGGERIEAATVVWAAGVRANPLARSLPATGSHRRAIVGPTLQVERHPEVFVVGDLAQIPGPAGPLPMVAQVAIQSGRHAARSVLGMAAGRAPGPFRYRDLGSMAVLGRGGAVAEVGPLHLSGTLGWLAWLGLHIARIMGLRAKASVVLAWASGFIFADRPVRLIAGPEHRVEASQSEPPPAAREPQVPPRADLPSVSVSNANRWGRRAALAWWSQDYPGLRPEPPRETGLAGLRGRATRLRHVLTGDKSRTEDWYRG